MSSHRKRGAAPAATSVQLTTNLQVNWYNGSLARTSGGAPCSHHDQRGCDLPYRPCGPDHEGATRGVEAHADGDDPVVEQ
eukprot:1580866-Prymnesium_polylepis.1